MQPLHDTLLGTPLPSCPYPTPPSSPSSSSSLLNPSQSVPLLILALTILTLAVLSKTRYDGARVFNRTLRDGSLRNGRWAAWCALLGTSYLIDFARYALDLPHQFSPGSPRKEDSTVPPQVIDSWLLLSSAVLRSLAVCAFTFALSWQLTHRSDSITSDTGGTRHLPYNPHPIPSGRASAGLRHASSTSSSSAAVPGDARPISYPSYGTSADTHPRRSSENPRGLPPDEEQGLLDGFHTPPDRHPDDEDMDDNHFGGWWETCVTGVVHAIGSWGFGGCVLTAINLAVMYLAM
ncbi:hypothetical protein HKX48_008925 [Thoreauomyces humboldtii]|nr:hypothetical protein HKX48_008925 [Thoreauomyces humboldtii]